MANTNSLIQQYNLLYSELLPNKTGKTGIKKFQSFQEKEEMSNRIAKLAKDIYDKAISLQSGPDFISLKNSLNSLYTLYRAIFIDEFRVYGQNLKNVKGVANNKKNIALNLREKNQNLKKINNNEQKKLREPMSISYSAYRP